MCTELARVQLSFVVSPADVIEPDGKGVADGDCV